LHGRRHGGRGEWSEEGWTRVQVVYEADVIFLVLDVRDPVTVGCRTSGRLVGTQAVDEDL
jgi:hypothetical protein